VLDVMTQLGIDKTALAGNSLGAMVAEYVALTHAPRVTQLALLSGTLSITQPPAGPPGGLLKRLFADRLEKRYFAQLRADPQAAYATLQPYYHDLAALPEQQRAFLFQRVNERVWDEAQRRAARSVRNAMPLFFAQHMLQIKRGVAALRIPTQIIWGANDVIFATANGPARAARQSGAQYHELAQCGHLPQQEQPMQIVHTLCA
jgi:pimeloyl-ACP methyl ester carboxylesterase